MPELIVDGKTGFLVDSPEDALQKLKEIPKIDRAYCREHVRKNFSLRKMVNAYLRLYQKVLRGESKN